MKLDIFICTRGALPWVKKCFDSLLPTVPKGTTVLVFDNPLSTIDGTRAYVQALEAEGKVKCSYSERDTWHGSTIDHAIERSDAEWLLVMDSDVEIKNGDWFELARRAVEANPRARLIARSRFMPLGAEGIAMGPVYGRIVLPAIETWFFLVNRKFVIDNRLSFTRIDFLADRASHTMSALPGKLTQFSKFQLMGDTAWMVFWSASSQRVFSEMPEELYRCHYHHWAKSTQFERQLRDEQPELMKQRPEIFMG